MTPRSSCYTCISTSWLTFFAATLDVPTTSPFSSKTSMPVFSSLFLISTTLHTLPVAEGQENEERGASRAIVSAATILTAHTYSESAPPNSVCLSKQVSRSYVTSQYKCQSIFNSPLDKVGSNALEGCSYENWLDVCGTVVFFGGHNIRNHTYCNISYTHTLHMYVSSIY